MVTRSAPSACAARTVQLFTASPLRCTVQAPQLEVSQPTCVPVRPRWSRMRWTSRRRGSTSWVRCTPFTVSDTRTGRAIRRSPPPLESPTAPDLTRATARCQPVCHPGAMVVRLVMHRDLSDVPAAWAYAPGPDGASFEGPGRTAAELVPAFVAAYPAGHPDHHRGWDPEEEER